MRRSVWVALAATLVVSAVGTPASQAADDPSVVGSWSAPFHEPYPAGATPYGRSTCYTHEVDGKVVKDCLPAGASVNQLADGRILYWNALEGSEDITSNTTAEAGDDLGNSRSRLLSLDGGPSWSTPDNEEAFFDSPDEGDAEPPLLPIFDNDNRDYTDESLFCSDNTFLPDGSVISAGGTNYYLEPNLTGDMGVSELEGLKSTRIFEPVGDRWAKAESMTWGRWYPSLVSLPNGRTLVVGGATKLIKPVYPDKHPAQSGRNVTQTETFDPFTRTWADNGDGEGRSLPLYPRLHLLPNGKVYFNAAGQAYNPAGQAYDEAVWNLAAVYDPATSTWTDLGVPGAQPGDRVIPTSGDPIPAEPGFRGSTFSQMLTLRPGADGEYRSASFLSAGGVVGTTPGSYVATRSSRIEQVTIGADGRETMRSLATGPIAEPRWYGSGVTLPDGTVFMASGGDLDGVVAPSSEKPIRTPELFTPNADGTDGTWRRLAAAERPRTYHNAAILLPDGRVLVGGNDPIPNGYAAQGDSADMPGRETANNSPDATFEIFSPPYLHYGVTRPQITAAPRGLTLGTTIDIETTFGDDIESVVLVRNPSVTHLIDGDQRNVELPIVAKGDGGVSVRIPSNPAVLPAGPYMLFVNRGSAKGLVPSESVQVGVFPAGTPVSPFGSASGSTTISTTAATPALAAATTPAPAQAVVARRAAPAGVLPRRAAIR